MPEGADLPSLMLEGLWHGHPGALQPVPEGSLAPTFPGGCVVPIPTPELHIPSAERLHRFLREQRRKATSCSIWPCQKEPVFRARPFPRAGAASHPAGRVAKFPRDAAEPRTEQSLCYPELTAR